MSAKKAIPIIGLSAVVLSYVLLKWMESLGFMPEAASLEAAYVDHAFNGMMRVTIPVFAFVMSVLVYSIVVFRAKDPSEEGVKFHGSGGGLVETVWLAVSLVLTLGLAAYGAKEFYRVRGTLQADLDIQVTASQFSWEFYYPEFKEYSPVLKLPVNKRVRLTLKSMDVVHSFWVPEFRLKQDVLPGKLVKLLFTPNKVGKYRLICSELCGIGHTRMTAAVEVLEADAFTESMQEESW